MEKQLTHAGGVVFYQEEGERKFLVVSSSDGQCWVLPKGHIERGEDAAAAALREIMEEAGVLGEIVRPLSVQQFRKGLKEAVIQYFLIRRTGLVDADEGRTVRWEDRVTALTLLTFPEAKAALLEGIAVLEPVNENR